MIKLKELVKRFGDRTVIDRLTITIQRGETFGLLGPNGAGKTTTIRILTMLTKATAGSVRIAGFTLPEDEQKIKSLIGVVPQFFNLDNELTAEENLELHGRLHHMDKAERRQRITSLLEYVELDDRAKDPVGKFSGGMKRRLMIARALLHRPQVLFLDEPTVGLDPQVRRRLWDLIRRMNEEGITVLLTTHYIEEAEHLCSRVAIVDKGKLIALDSPKELCHRVGQFVVEWTEADALRTQFFANREAAAQFVGNLSCVAAIRHSNLEDVFVELTGRKVTG